VITWSDIADNKPGNPLIAHHAMPHDPFTYGQQLYAKLHQFDQTTFDLLLIETPPDHTDWLAVSDRLRRAGHRFFDNN
jgi:L-threonylcarbamoyladenylate synthase